MKNIHLNQNEIEKLLPARKKNTHKGDYGKLLLLCGSKGYTGAAALSAMGALRTGAGLVYLGVPESVYGIIATKLLEPVVLPLPDTDGKLNISSIIELSKIINRMDAVLVGPGLGLSEGTSQIICWLLENYDGPLVVDADGINLMKPHMDVLRGRTSPTILTPHADEFLRLGGNLDKGRVASAVEMANEISSIIVLKGNETVITDGKTIYVNPTGNPGMAVGGSGDVLAGIIVSLLGQKLTPLEAAACGAWLHGAAGDICAYEIGQYGMLPSDMLEVLPRLLK